MPHKAQCSQRTEEAVLIDDRIYTKLKESSLVQRSFCAFCFMDLKKRLVLDGFQKNEFLNCIYFIFTYISLLIIFCIIEYVMNTKNLNLVPDTFKSILLKMYLFIYFF